MSILSLRSNDVTDKGLASLKRLRNLTNLDLDETLITGAGVLRLAGLPKLTRLQLDHNAVGDGVFAPLLQMRQLRSVSVGDTDVTPAAVGQFTETNPAIRVVLQPLRPGRQRRQRRDLNQYDTVRSENRAMLNSYIKRLTAFGAPQLAWPTSAEQEGYIVHYVPSRSEHVRHWRVAKNKDKYSLVVRRLQPPPMMFDAPESDRNPATWMLAVSVGVFPFSCFLAIILSWLFLRLGNKSLWAFLIPVINLVVGVVALCWLQIAYGGNFGS